jgi:putative solute:sodium symporter small subunit
MSDNTTHDSVDGLDVEADDGTASGASRDHRDTDYLDREVNLLRPSTPFMRDHLRIIWTGFVVWALVVFGPVTLTAVAPGPMTVTMPILGFPLHYFLVAIGAPVGALVLAFWYARKRDALDEKYGIEHGAAASDDRGGDPEGVSADGGAVE